MRPQRNERMSAPAPTNRATGNLPATGFALIVDGQAKKDFDARDQALKIARDFKHRFPRLQVKVYDAEARRNEEIEHAPA